MSGLGTLAAVAAVYWRLAVALILLLILASVFIRTWNDLRFLMMRVWYALPLIGKAKRLSRNIHVDDTAIAGEHWFQSELTLCSEFKSALDRLASDPEMYDHSKRYLAKVHELDRSPLSLGGWVLISLLVFVESLGFAYVLAGYTLPGASEALQIPGALGIAFLISVILVFLTHMAGSEWHRRSLVQRARLMWLHDEPKSQRKNLIVTRPMGLERDNEDDKDDNGKPEKPYLQLINRLNTNATTSSGTPWWNVGTIFAIAIIAIGAFYVRYETYERDATCATMNASAVGNIFGGGIALPSILVQPQQNNVTQGASQQCRANAKANIATYLVLALVFVLVQVIGWTMGNRTGFAGAQSREAWLRTYRFGNRREYENWYRGEAQKIAGIAQRHLANLQSLLAKRIQAVGVDTDADEAITVAGRRTFQKFAADDALNGNISGHEKRKTPEQRAPQPAG